MCNQLYKNQQKICSYQIAFCVLGINYKVGKYVKKTFWVVVDYDKLHLYMYMSLCSIQLTLMSKILKLTLDIFS